MDALKAAVANYVYRALDPQSLADALSAVGPAHQTIEVQRPTTLAAVLRVSTNHGPRYFQVRVSEIL